MGGNGRCSGILRAGRTLRRVLLSRIHGSFPGGGRVWAGWGHDDAVLGEAVSAGESGQASSMEAAQAGGTACWESLFLMPSPRWSIRVPPGPLRSFRDVEKNFFQRPFDASLRKSRGGGKKAGRREKKREKDGGGIAGARSTAGFRLFLWATSCPIRARWPSTRGRIPGTSIR